MPLSTHHQPAIRHAVVALASLHERFENNDSSILSSNCDIAQGGFALQQYNHAIGCLMKLVSAGEHQALEISLVACILFACFEVRFSVIASFMGYMISGIIVGKFPLTGSKSLRGHYGSAISHIRNGVKIISSSKSITSTHALQSLPLIPSPVPCVSLKTLEVLFARLDYQSNQVSSLRLQSYAQSTY